MAFRFQLFIFLCLSGMSTCRADLGETLDQLILRYGDPDPDKSYYVDHPKERVCYSFDKDPYSIDAYFQNGVVSREYFSKIDKSSFSDTEITNFLKNNCLAGQVWSGPILGNKLMTWTRSDGAIARYDFGRSPYLFVESESEYHKSTRNPGSNVANNGTARKEYRPL